MSRSNPTTASANPSTRWFEWAGGNDGGFLRHYDKATAQNVVTPLPFAFLLLDELSTVKGWHDGSDSGIYANEVRDTRNDALVVRAFKGGELASGLYAGIRDRVRAMGGHYHASIYIAFKGDDGLVIGNLGLKGAALNAWVDFKKVNRAQLYRQAVVITGFADGKKGATSFRTPTFALKECSEETQNAALALDQELQAYLATYLASRRDDAAETSANAVAQLYGRGGEDVATQTANEAFAEAADELADEIPF